MWGRRLQAVAAQIPRCKLLADVGCDHGLLAEYALENGLCEAAVLADISAPSLDKAVRRCARFAGRVTAVVSDGFDNVPEQVDAALICGMGGGETIQILRRRRVPQLVLQPMRDVPAVREYLAGSGFKIYYDAVAAERGKFYHVLAARDTGAPYALSPRERIFGKTNLEAFGEEFAAYLCAERARCCALLSQPLPGGRRTEIAEYIRDVEELLNEHTRGR